MLCGEALKRRVPLALALMTTMGGAALTTRVFAAGSAAVGATPVPESAASGDAFLEQYAATLRFSLGRPGAIKVTPSGDAVLFLRSGPRSFVQSLYSFDTATGKERELLAAEQLLGGGEEQLTPEERARRERMRSSARGIASYELSDDGRRILVPLSGRLFVVDRATGKSTELKSKGAPAEDPHFSPDGAQLACVRDGDLFVLDVASAVERRLTHRDSASVTNGVAEFVAQEEMDRFRGYWWSPDSKWIAFERADAAGVEQFHIMDPAHPEQSPQSWPYPRPGGKNVEVTLGVMSAAGGATSWIKWDRARYPYLCSVCWPKNAPLTLLVMNREQTEEALLAADPASGQTRTLLVEKDAAWLNLVTGVARWLEDGRSFGALEMPHWLEDGSAFVWATERNGGLELELRARDGALLHSITDPALGLLGLLDLDEKRSVAWLNASDDPTQAHLWRVPLDPKRGKPERVTLEPGLHGAVFSAGHEVLVHFFDGLSGQRVRRVERTDGTVIGELSSVAETPALEPRVELTTAGALGFRAAIVRPRDFDARKRYPVILSVYGGPTALVVRASRGHYLLQQWIADHGFIVVSMDARGTPGRGRAWERVIKNDFIGTPLDDQVEGLKALGERYPELDLTRAGIFGWSFGGYFSAMAVARRPEVFRAGVAGAPVADWHDYDTFYTERYIGLPETDANGYEVSSVLTYAPKLECPLLIIHGTADDNVYLLHSMKLMEALNAAGKSFEFLPLVGKTHMVSDPPSTVQLYRRIMDFFGRELGAPR